MPSSGSATAFNADFLIQEIEDHALLLLPTQSSQAFIAITR
jgi:hypothetical protein